MRMPKFFVDAVNDGMVKISGGDAAHIKTVLRARVSDNITVCDGNGMDYVCVIEDLNGKSVTARVVRSFKNENEPDFKITLYQALPKLNKMDMVIQKCVEIGVEQIVPVITEHTVVKYNDGKIVRYNKIAEAAAKQCGRGKIPAVLEALTFKEAVSDALGLDGAIIPYEKENEGRISAFAREFKGRSIGVFIGPEGGFSDSEIGYALDNGIAPVTLGKRILRTETAGMVALVILLNELEGGL